MTKWILAVFVALAVSAPVAHADGLSAAETKQAAARLVAIDLAPNLTSRWKLPPHRVYNCRPGRCDFWVKGTSQCSGVVGVRDSPDSYLAWFQRLDCESVPPPHSGSLIQEEPRKRAG